MAIFTVTNLDDSGAGSLRAAIEAANADSSGTPTVIEFQVAGIITLDSDLPPITQTVAIDGTSAPGYVVGGPPAIEIDANGSGGLVFDTGSAGSQLLGLAIGNATGNGVTLNDGSITLNGNYIGVGLDGFAAANSGAGVFVASTSNDNRIGLNPTNASGVVGNVISGNGGNGITIDGSTGNTIVANRIGTDPTGTAAVANGGNGIWVTGGASNNVIGGTVFVDAATGQANNPTGSKGTTTPTFIAPPLGNLISGNGANGVLIDANSTGNVLNGNFIGTDADGNAALGNVNDGVWIDGADDNSLIGCQFVNDPFVYYNVVSGNGANGLQITNANNITVQANFFGVGADNTTVLGNSNDGILIDGTSQNVQVGGVIPLGNVVSGNLDNGIEVADEVSGFETFNTFGGLLAFKGAAPNGNDGLLITSTGGNNLVRTNVFSGNANNGIELAGNASGVTLDPNLVGLNTRGDAALPNGGNGLLITDTAHDNTIGGYLPSVIFNQTFSGNVGYGIAIMGEAYDNVVFNNHVGTNILGAAAVPNGAGGIYICDSSNNNIIGGVSADPSQPVANLISGNTGNGVTLDSGNNNNQVIGNRIGVDVFGGPLLNTGVPIFTEGSTGFYGPTGPGAFFLTADGRLVQGSNSGNGLFVAGTANTVQAGVKHDAILVGGDANTISGGGGNDSILANGADDAIFGDSGNDRIFSLGDRTTLAQGLGNDTVVAFGDDDTVLGGTGDNFVAVGGDRALIGDGAGASTILAVGTGATVSGGAGDDRLVVSGPGASLDGGPGHDTIFAGGDNDTVTADGAALIYLAGGSQTVLDGPTLYHDTVIGFDQGAGDTILLTGGNTSEFALANSRQVHGGRDTLITLNDGSTILLKHVSQIDGSFFS